MIDLQPFLHGDFPCCQRSRPGPVLCRFQLRRRRQSVLLAYLDESHTKERYFIAALLVPEQEANSLTNALDDVVEKAMQEYGGILPSAELHGYDIVAGK